MKITQKLYIICSLITIGGLFSCSDDDPPIVRGTDPKTNTTSSTPDFSAYISNITNNVIIKTYADLDKKAQELVDLSNNFSTQSNATALEGLRQAWRDTRVPWEESESFLYGPAETEEIDPAIDSWPLEFSFYNAVLNGTEPITANALKDSNEHAKGFHTIEYLLWGLDGDKTVSDFTEREIMYLQAATQNLRNNTQTLYNAWQAGGENYAANFLKLPNKKYTSQKGVIIQMVEGLAAIADEISNNEGKIAGPLNAENPKEEEESRFSDNSKTDLINNIKSIRNVYLGDYGDKQGLGISELIIKLGNPTFDNTIKTEISDALNAIQAMPGTLSNAIANNRVMVEAAQESVSTLLNSIKTAKQFLSIHIVNEKLPEKQRVNTNSNNVLRPKRDGNRLKHRVME